LHHGDNEINRGGPPGFWEVVLNEPYTGVTLQRLTKDLDGGTVIGKAFIKTDRTSFYRNQHAIFQAGVHLFNEHLKRLVENDEPANYFDSQPAALFFYSHPLYKDPDNKQAVRIFFQFWLRRIKELVFQLLKKEQWRLYYKFNQNKMETSLFRYRELKPPKGTDWADPFVIFANDVYHVFIEEKQSHLPGAISLLCFSSQGQLLDGFPQQVLKEPFHLSYPFVFKHENDYFLLPEMAEAGKLVLYKSTYFPYQWEPYFVMLDGISLYDPTLVYHENKWYLFGTQKLEKGDSADMYLHIYYADALTGSWKPHMGNPLKQTVCGSRPAGRFFQENGRLIRPAQNGAPKYGYSICFYEVEILSPTEYKERFISNILPCWKKGLKATHTFNSEKGLTIVDAQC
jgi:hypothetical protein